MSRNASLAVLVLLTPMAVMAEDKLPTVPEVMAQVEGTKVDLQGYIGRGPEGNVRFVPAEVQNSGFPVDFKSQDDMDKAIQGCGFDGSGGLPCKMAGHGYTHWEGSRLRIVLTDIDTIAAPAAVK